MFFVHYIVHRDGVPVWEVRENFNTKDMLCWDDFFAAIDEHAAKQTKAVVVLDNKSTLMRKHVKESMAFDWLKDTPLTLTFRYNYDMQ